MLSIKQPEKFNRLSRVGSKAEEKSQSKNKKTFSLSLAKRGPKKV